MNFLEQEMQDALEKENAMRKKDGLPPLKSNMTIIDCTKAPRTELKKLDSEKLSEKNKRWGNSMVCYEIAHKFSRLVNKINYRLPKLKNKCIDWGDYAVKLKEIRKNCVRLDKKYTSIGDKIESGEIEFNDNLIEQKDLDDYNTMGYLYAATWNDFVANYNRNKRGV
tara:strand:- start:1130 stop:1630 length:501 start_codon:yes stop_codon:yes gene_type:complete